MSGASTSAGDWCDLLDPVRPELLLPDVRRSDDPRLGEFVEIGLAGLRPGRAVIVGFPQDEGIRRNHGRPGTALAPDELRRFLFRLTPWDAASDVDLAQTPPVDVGNLRITPHLEQTQAELARVIEGVVRAGGIPVVLGGGHETALGHYLGYARAGRKLGIINIDAHLDVRPTVGGLGHSGSPFRECLEHPEHPLAGHAYVCLGAQPGNVSREHARYVLQRGGRIYWRHQAAGRLGECFGRECQRLAELGCQTYVTVDADAMRVEQMPGVSAPNPDGLEAGEVLGLVRRAGQTAQVAGLDLVEINPHHDRDCQCVRWGGLALWHFLVGLAEREGQARTGK